MITRRLMLAAGLGVGAFGARSMAADGQAIAAAAPFHVPPGGRLAFAVWRNGSQIGTHTLVFEGVPDGTLLVRIDVRMKVEFGPLTLFRYHLQANERWQGSRFLGLESTTDNDGEALHLSATRQPDGRIRLTGTKVSETLLPADTLPLTHWNRRMMRVPLFNPQDGTAVHDTASCVGIEPVEIAGGRAVRATHYALRGETALDDWYDAADTWVALRAIAKDGSTVTYRQAAPGALS